MAKFRKRPIEVEAARVSDLIRAAVTDWAALPAWLRAGYEDGGVVFGCSHIAVETRQGWAAGLSNDWIIRGVEGELYPCRPDVFALTYDAVADTARAVDDHSPRPEPPPAPPEAN